MDSYWAKCLLRFVTAHKKTKVWKGLTVHNVNRNNGKWIKKSIRVSGGRSGIARASLFSRLKIKNKKAHPGFERRTADAWDSGKNPRRGDYQESFSPWGTPPWVSCSWPGLGARQNVPYCAGPRKWIPPCPCVGCPCGWICRWRPISQEGVQGC